MVGWLEEVALGQHQHGPCMVLSARPLPIMYSLQLFCKSKHNGCSLPYESQNMPSQVILSAINHGLQPGVPSTEFCVSPQTVSTPRRPHLWGLLTQSLRHIVHSLVFFPW